MFEYLMIWMPPRTDRCAARVLDYGTIAALIVWTIGTVVALVDTNVTATFAILGARI